MSEPGDFVREDRIRQMIQDEMAGRSAQELAQEPPPASRIAELTPLGIAAFALTTFILSCVNARLLGEGTGPGALTWLPLAFFYGGLVQLIAGIGEARNNNVFGAVVFCSFGGGFWPALAFFFFGRDLGLLQPSGQPVFPAAGFFLVGWTIFVLYLTIASAKVNLTVFLTFIVFMITLILLDIGFMTGTPGLIDAGGYAGILLAAFAWYVSAAGVINHTWDRAIVPLGPPLGE